MLYASIIIRTTFKRYFLPSILKELSQQISDEDEIIIVNDSKDKISIPEYIKRYKNVRVIKSKKHGYAQSRNVGIKNAKKEIIAFVDDDCIPRKNWLEEIKKIYQTDYKIGAVGGPVIIHREKNLVRKFEEIGLFLCNFLFGDYRATGKIYSSGLVTSNFDLGKDIQEVDHLNGSNLTFRRSALKGILTDENYKGNGYREETDLCWQVKKKGYKIIFTPHAIVDHYIGKTRRDKNSMYWKSYNHYYFWKKNFSFNLLFFIREFVESIFLLIAAIITFNKDYLYGIKGKIDGFKDFYLSS